MRSMIIGLAVAGIATGIAAGAIAAPTAITVEKSVFRETIAQAASGERERLLEPADRLRCGDTVVLMLEWRASGRAENFMVSSRVPRDLAFRRSGAMPAQLSIDGGRNWGELETLRKDTRRATPEDVTHLRWHVSEGDAALGRGLLTYSAIVR